MTSFFEPPPALPLAADATPPPHLDNADGPAKGVEEHQDPAPEPGIEPEVGDLYLYLNASSETESPLAAPPPVIDVTSRPPVAVSPVITPGRGDQTGEVDEPAPNPAEEAAEPEPAPTKRRFGFRK